MDPNDAGRDDAVVARWIEALEARHLADLRPVEIARALRALSSAYVERRDRLGHGAALDGAGKRAAFALFYGPLHFLMVQSIVGALGADAGPPGLIVDLGCGTGVAGAAWALACTPRPRIAGFDRHPWAADEARWTCKALGLDADVRCADVGRVRVPSRASAIVAAFTVNELPDETRDRMLREFVAAHARGARVLIVEPIARTSVPWWDGWRTAFVAAGGREDLWRVPADLPDVVARLDHAAGLDHRELTARSLYLGVH
ncbi:MAG: class I SAM-dependent methyltransferase [Acidobacteria bacterium]|nr:class I SAM-dependent methyltransferase [Acidobacteriota bacterium]